MQAGLQDLRLEVIGQSVAWGVSLLEYPSISMDLPPGIGWETGATLDVEEVTAASRKFNSAEHQQR